MEKPLTDDLTLARVNTHLVQGKRNTFLLLLLMISCIAFGCGILFYRGGEPYLVKMCSFLLLGFVFATATQTKIETANSFVPVVLAIAIQAVVIVVAIIARHFEVSSQLVFFAAFLLPVFVMQAWKQFVLIPRRAMRTWHYSSDMPQKPPFVYLDGRPILFKILLPSGVTAMVRSEAPGQMQLGMAFYFAVQDQDEEMKSDLSFVDEQRQPYKWMFYMPGFGRKKYLDPEENLYENGVSAKSMIVAERV